MEQHPIPQNVSSYQFKLVGDMTLKQFFQLAGGIVVGIIFYSTPLMAIIRYPLALISILLGIGLAFLPLEERPLEKWIFAFFRAIYSPTIFTWQKTKAPVKYFQDETPEVSPVAPTAGETALKNYLSTTQQPSSASGNLEKAESGFLSKLAGLFTINPQATTSSPQPTANPNEVASMALHGTPLGMQGTTQPGQPTVSSFPIGNIVSMENSSQVVTPVAQDQKPTQNGPQIPQISPVKIQPTGTKVIVEEATTPAVASSGPISPIVAGNEMVSTRQAIFSPDAAPPSPPTNPNVVVGQVVDQDRKIVEGAIMEIRDSDGRPIRALRSNKVGHFITVTQLDNGHYEIITEKDGYEFASVSFDAKGALIPPILVEGKRLGPYIEPPPVIVKPAYSIN